MDELDLTDYILIMSRRRRLILSTAFAFALIMLLALMLLPRTYRGKAVLIFPNPQQSAGSSLMANLAGIPAIADLGIVSSNSPAIYSEILKSRTLGNQVVNDLGLFAVGVEGEDLAQKVDVNIKKSGAMEISCYAPTNWVNTGKLHWLDERYPKESVRRKTAHLAAELTNSFIRNLEKYDRQHSLSSNRRNREFLEREVAKTGAELAAAEESFRHFKQDNPLLPPPEAAVQQIERILGVRSKQIEAETELRAADESIEQAEDVIADQELLHSAAKVIQENPVVVQLKTQLAQAEVLRAELLEDRTELAPEVVAATQQIEKIREKINQEIPRITASETLQLNQVHQSIAQDLARLEVTRSGLEARIKALNEVMSNIEHEMSDMAEDQMEYMRLYREVKALETINGSLRTSLSQAKVTEAKEPEGFSVLDWATAEKSHFKPRIKLTVAAVFILGIITGSLLAFVQEGRRMRKPHALQQTDRI